MMWTRDKEIMLIADIGDNSQEKANKSRMSITEDMQQRKEQYLQHKQG